MAISHAHCFASNFMFNFLDTASINDTLSIGDSHFDPLCDFQLAGTLAYNAFIENRSYLI